MTFVKICGITNLTDAELAASLGADALGFNFYIRSKRYIEPGQAADIVRQLSPEIMNVGVFVNETLENIEQIVEEAGLDAIQLHGDEDAEFVTKIRIQTQKEVIKAVRVEPDFEVYTLKDWPANAILLDAYSVSERGGTGETFDWEIARRSAAVIPRLYLAGGLSPDNVGEAIRQVNPYAVDTCSRIESLPGMKDPYKLRQFISAAKTRI